MQTNTQAINPQISSPSSSQLSGLIQQIPHFLHDHRVENIAILPGVYYFEMAISAITRAGLTKADSPIRFERISFNTPLLLADDPSVTVTVSPSSASTELLDIAIADTETQYANFQMHSSGSQPTHATSVASELELIRKQCTKEISSQDFYSELAQNGNHYGTAFQTVHELHVGPDQSYATILSSNDIASNKDTYFLHPDLLDGCIQTLAATHDENRSFVLIGIDTVEVYQEVSSSCIAYAVKHEQPDKNHITGTIFICSPIGELLVSMHNVCFQYLTDHQNEINNAKEVVAVSATFTADPIEDALSFWQQQLGKDSRVEFAPYNQVFQQLLMPNSLLNTNEMGVNVLLVRLEDWAQSHKHIPLRVSASEKETILAAHQQHKLRAGIEIAHLNQYETEYVYQEIFEDLAYMKHGISISDGDCIIDIGANIGLFTLFVQQQASNATVYSFEPSPPVFQLLNANAKLYGENVHVFNLGVSDRKKEAEFTFYEKSSVFSSFSADRESDEHAIRAVIENMVRDNDAVDSDQVDQLVNDLISDRLTSTNYTCQLISLSDIIRENQIEQIDLLKLDAEKSELPVLQGIRDEDWPKIKQIVMEVHDQEGPLIEEVTQILRSKGFVFEIEEEEFLHNSGLYNIFAKRPSSDNESMSVAQEEHVIAEQSFGDTITKNVSDLLAALDASSKQRNVPTVLATCPPSPIVKNDVAKMTVLQDAERVIRQAAEAMSNIGFLSTNEIENMYPVDDYYDLDGEKLGHIPYTTTYFSALGTAIMRRNNALQRPPYKVIVLDCDNTLWKGVCGEDGTEGIELPAPFIALQHFMRAQLESGMVLCLCSKNTEDDVWAVFDNRDDMVLQRDDIVAHRINWNPKSQNLRELAQELQLGLDSFIFLDDNPVECAEVRAASPQVLTLQLPDDLNAIQSFLENVWAFDHLTVTGEDKKRTEMYRENRERENFRKSSVTLQSFLDSLNLDVQVGEMLPENLERVSQLTYRTNQFNFTTNRRSTAEIQQAIDSGELFCLVANVTDRFGDYGRVGVVLYSVIETGLSVDTFLLSCRVLGRGVEHQMVASLGRVAQQHGLTMVKMPFIPTKKNQPAVDFLESIAKEYKSVGADNRNLYSLPTSVAASLTYRPADDQEYAEKAIQRSTEIKTPKVIEDSFIQFDSGQQMQQIATDLTSAQAILDQIIALPAKNVRSTVDANYAAPIGELQGAVVDIWQQLLSISQVGVNDNFFEIGGSSLKGVQLIANLKRHLGIELGIVDLFAAPTVRTMTELIDQQRSGKVVVSTEAKESESRGSKRRDRVSARRRR